MWGIPNSAVYGTYKKMKHHTKRKAKAPKGARLVTKDISLHKERSAEELIKLLQHAEQQESCKVQEGRVVFT